MKLQLIFVLLLGVTIRIHCQDETTTDNESRILGGVEETEQQGRYPSVVSLQKETKDGTFKYPICAGSILNHHWILTAARCIHVEIAKDPKKLWAYAGIVDIGYPTSANNKGGFQVSRALEVYIHPFFSLLQNVHNLALVYLEDPFGWNQFIQPAILPHIPLHHNDPVRIMGWGPFQTSTGLVATYNLITAVVSIKPYANCNASFPKSIESNLDNVFCVGQRDQTACASDLGGPLETVDSKILYGVASKMAVKCDQPTVYTNIQPYVDTFITPLMTNREAIKDNMKKLEEIKKQVFDYSRFYASFTVAIHSNPLWLPNVREKLCTGSFIDLQWIVTAAHCLDLDRSNGTGLFIVSGTSTQYSNSRERYSAEFAPVKFAFKHPKYRKGEVANDIALLYLETPLMDTLHQVLTLPSDETYQNRLPMLSTGYTVTPGNSVLDHYDDGHLVVAEMEPIAASDCIKHLPDASDDNILCYANLQAYPCSGDTGGALFERKTNILFGIATTSYGQCGTHPEPFVKVAKHLDFLKNTMKSI